MSNLVVAANISVRVLLVLLVIKEKKFLPTNPSSIIKDLFCSSEQHAKNSLLDIFMSMDRWSQ